jgi:hypothetical protein
MKSLSLLFTGGPRRAMGGGDLKIWELGRRWDLGYIVPLADPKNRTARMYTRIDILLFATLSLICVDLDEERL